MLALQGDLERAGGAVALRSPVEAMHCGAGGHRIEVGGDEPMALRARCVVNAAGLRAPALALDDARARRAPRAAGALQQGQLLRARRPGAVLRASSIRCRRTPGSACT